MTHPINIGLTGMARAGKDTVANILIKQLGYHRVSVADPLKFGIDAALGCFGATPADETKDIVIPELGTTPRQIWKDFSEEFLKKYFGRDIMARIMAKRCETMQGPLVVTDVRFNEEAALLVRQGFLIIKVERPGQVKRDQDNHVSENGIDSKYVYGTVYNYHYDQPAERDDALLRSVQGLLSTKVTVECAGRNPHYNSRTFNEVLNEVLEEDNLQNDRTWRALLASAPDTLVEGEVASPTVSDPRTMELPSETLPPGMKQVPLLYPCK